jgi:hypothetical protein|tara:strand:- start:165 stop:389 length:225 start_codon:yes stop_codon:yes gene_type:complete
MYDKLYINNDETSEEEATFNEVEKLSGVKKEILRRTAKEWNFLTDKDVKELIGVYPSFEGFVRTVEKKVKEKNT